MQTNITELFDVYRNATTSINLEDAKQFIYTLRPKTSGTLEFPAIEVSYYDYEQRTYTTRKTTPIPIRVNKAIQISSAEVLQGITNTPQVAGNQPIRADSAAAAMRHADTVHPNSPHTRLFWILLAAGPSVLGLTACVERIGRRWNSTASIESQHRKSMPGQSEPCENTPDKKT